MKVFTLEDANETLAAVRPLVERLVEARQRLVGATEALAEVQQKVATDGGGLNPPRIRAAAEDAVETASRVAALVTALETLGVQVKDLDRGLVDFPARHPADGSDVLLCWHLGEDEVAYWHGVEEGFAGRKPLPF